MKSPLAEVALRRSRVTPRSTLLPPAPGASRYANIWSVQAQRERSRGDCRPFDARPQRDSFARRCDARAPETCRAIPVLIHADPGVHPDLLNSHFGYVSVSRASHEATSFTNDAAKLGQQVSAEVTKTSAVEINQSASLGQPFLGLSFFGILVEFTSSGGGEIGRRTSLRCWRPQGIGVQVPSSAPETPPEYPSRLGKQLRKCRFFFTSSLPFTCSCACS
jgi:hypothetical protein